MRVEYEAMFPDIEKDEIRERLKNAGAVLAKPEFLQKRVVFALPLGHEIQGGWLRVRDEGDGITMSLKVVDGAKIENQKEICLSVDDFEQAEALLTTLGCWNKSYQETKRELWTVDDTEVMIDEWPFLRPFVEIEGETEEVVRRVSEKLGFDYAHALFGAVDVLYMRQYPYLTAERINTAPLIVFDGEHPFFPV